MSNGSLKLKTKEMKWFKYFIFSFAILLTFFVMQTSRIIKAATPTATFEMFESNHNGDNSGGSYDAIHVCASDSTDATCDKKVSEAAYGSGWYIQSKGTANSTTVSFQVVISNYPTTINGVSVFESKYSSSAGANASYDAYALKDTTWENVTGKTGSGINVGQMVTTLAAGEHLNARDTSLKANTPANANFSMMHISQVTTTTTTITINYVYTIRSNDYGEKIVSFAVYNTNPYNYDTGVWNDAMVAETFAIKFIAAKPADEFDIQWLNTDTEEVGKTGTVNVNQTDNITVKYLNGGKATGTKTMEIKIPGEMAYLHNVSKQTAAEIPQNSIYAINSFTNDDSRPETCSTKASCVKYYYYKFNWDTTTGDNIEMSPLKTYDLVLVIDAKGSYSFYITDVFGNTVSSADSTNDDEVVVEDVSNTNIIADYTNAQDLTILVASGAYSGDDWKNDWTLTIDASTKIDFTKMDQDSIEVVIHTFHRIVISEGIYVGGTGVEPIAKKPLNNNEDASVESNAFAAKDVSIWRVKTISGDAGVNTNVSCGTTGNASSATDCFSTVTFSTSTSDYGTGTSKNKITFTIYNNGRYRIQITDNYTNSTNALTGASKNPAVEVTTIDKTDPIITSGLTGATSSAASTSIESYAYVNGGGEKTSEVPGSYSDVASNDDYYKTPASYTSIYYEVGGTKAFDYKDALEIAKIKVVDDVWYYDGSVFNKDFNDYQLYMYADGSANHGKYIDPSAEYLSDRNTTSTTVKNGSNENMHDYIINKNITSFTGGLVRQVGYTEYASDDFTKVVGGRETSNAFVNKKSGAITGGYGEFLGYLKIKFKRAGTNNVVCELKIDTAKDNNDPASTLLTATTDADNLACMKKINKMIDDVENFDMVFSTVDFLGNASNEYTVTVNIIDTTNPGIINVNPLEYNNMTTTCKLEIGNFIQDKATLLECYKLTVSGVYSYKDNNVHDLDNWDTNTADSDYVYDYNERGNQFYAKAADGTELTASSNDHYFNKIKLYVYEDGLGASGYQEIAVGSIPFLKKSGDHILKIEIRDHWDTLSTNAADADNLLTFYVNYYVNPRTLLIEPLATEKMYGENDPTLDYCVYVNSFNETFNLEAAFFDVEFINTYFTTIYCTKDVYVKVENSNKYKVSSTPTKSYTVEVAEEEINIAYQYNVYTQDNAGTHLKVGNTYVDMSERTMFNGYFKQSATGNYLKVGTAGTEADYKEIKSGYLYNSSTCKYAYMGTGDMYLNTGTSCVKVESANRYEKAYVEGAIPSGAVSLGQFMRYNNSASNGTANAALVNSNEFQGQLTRVESSCYNSFEANRGYDDYLTSCASADAIASRNDNVGRYHIALGTLSVKPVESGGSTLDYNEDYVIKINTNYFAEHTNFVELTGANASNKQTRDSFDANGKLIDDTIFAESNVNFTIRQAVLTITTNGSSKKYGEQDPYTNVWNNTTTPINAAGTGYLGGYSIHGFRNNDTIAGNSTIATATYIIEGTLRREVGEEVGTYRICNLNSNPKTVDGNTTDGCNRSHEAPGYYDETTDYLFAAYDLYAADGTGDSASLHIRTNNTVYGTTIGATGKGRTLNAGTRNYAISFVNENKLSINAIDLVVQPGVNQGKEYSASQYHDPLWQIVLYGEANISDGFDEAGGATENDAKFNGYTTDVVVDSNASTPSIGLEPYYTLTGTPKETEVYYARRKTTPSAEYKYKETVTLSNYDKYVQTTVDGVTVYYKDNTAGTYIYAFGKYYSVAGAGASIMLTVDGHLVNESYTLFDTNFALTRDSDSGNVGWYTYTDVLNYKEVSGTKYYTIKPVTQRTDDECVISTTETAVNPAAASGKVKCRNYNVVYTSIAPDQASNVYTTIYADSSTQVYEPDGVNACTSTTAYSLPCTGTTTEIMFEIFKREIIVEFIDDNYTFIYGNRYDYYDGGTATSVTNYTYNTNTNGIFNIKNTTSEGNIFLCYSDLADYLVDCTNDNDYGLTAGDTWSNIGLKFYLQSTVSKYDGGYYTAGTDKALPAGTYYVYAEIGKTDNASHNNTVLNNYKFTYRGGTLTIKPKTTSVELSGYTMEYGESNYYSYGTGSNYSEYTVYTNCVVSDALYKTTDTTLIEINDCSTANVKGNTYGFTIEGLDSKDTIANNFKGRPARAARNGSNVGVYDDVGYYKIGVNTIANIQDKSVSFERCLNYKNADGTFDTDCIFVGDPDAPTSDVNAKNYDISYSLSNNEGAYLFITPAKLTIEVFENQTKMYGCAYYKYVTDGSTYYNYSYENGYVTDNCATGTDSKLDMAYKYSVSGDKDVGSTYNVDTTTAGVQQTTIADESKKSKMVLTDTRLYRVEKEADNTYAYGDIRAYDQTVKYQGQSVAVYTITLGNLSVKDNVNTTMCDAYNNPILANGTETRYACKNYNINYYGNSTTTDISAHTYTETTQVEVEKLAKYVLNYQVDNTDGEYIFVNGKYVRITDLTVTGENVLVNSYVTKTSLTKYNKLTEYMKITESACNTDLNNCYVYVDLDGTGSGVASYVTISSLSSYRYNDFNGTTANASGAYLKIGANYIKLSTLLKYEKVTDAYVANASGAYVNINNEYVQLSSLKTYTYDSTTNTYAVGNGDYVLIYETRPLSSFTRYTLSATSATMYKHDQSADVTDNVYVFIDGTYVPYKSLTITSGKVTVNQARTYIDSQFGYATGSVTTDTDFTITARIVYVHPEYNVKSFQNNDPLEYITCTEISTAYYTTNNKKDGRSYCNKADGSLDGAKHIDLGVSMYYAIQNSLAKSPWTAWTDLDTYATETVRYSLYNDIQFDVLTGKVSRLMTTANGKDDKAGKYTYDFAAVTNVGTLNGSNYLIVYATNYEMHETMVELEAGSKVKLSKLVYNYVGDGNTSDDCKLGDDYCAYVNVDGTKVLAKVANTALNVNTDGKVVSSGGTATSISLIQKYNSSNAAIDYWYLGFYKDDTRAGREDELAKWWISRDVFSTPYDTFKNSDTENGNLIQDKYFATKTEIYFEIIRRTIYLYAVDAEKVYGEADNYNDFLVAICGTADGYIIDSNGVKCKSESNDESYGLGEADKGKFVDASGYMKQNQIKNNGNEGEYIFKGEAHKDNSFGIYFRRANSENAGVYTLTACATQTDIIDCTNKDESETEHTSTNYIGDNYKIIEISGVFTINPRQININPHTNQGFEYGNYTDNGTMPNITFSEASVLGHYDAANSRVTINEVEYTIDGTALKKRTLSVGTINTSTNTIVLNGVTYTISGTDILNKNGLVFGSGTFIYSGTTQVAEITVANSSNALVNEFVISTNTYYIDGLDVINKGTGTLAGRITIDSTTVTNVNFKTITVDGVTYDLIQKARCLINVSGLHTICINDGQNERLGITVANLFDGNGDINPKYAVYGANYTAAALTTSIRVGTSTASYTNKTVKEASKSYYNYNVYADDYSNPAKTYSRSETSSRNALTMVCGTGTAVDVQYSRDVCAYDIVIQNSDGSVKYLNVSNNVRVETAFYVHLAISRRYNQSGSNYVQADDGSFVKFGNQYVKISDYTRYRLAKPEETTGLVDGKYIAEATGDYIKVTVTSFNYEIAGFDATQKFTVTAATIELTPDEKQYKIYGEADPEIKFTINTVYDVSNTHYQKFSGSSIIRICNNKTTPATCYTGENINAFRYQAAGGTQSNSGDYILLIRGWTVTLSTFAYAETSGSTNYDAHLDYGQNFTSTKYGKASSALDQSANDVIHYDKYTTYKNSINTNRILIGNLYVTDKDQSVGVKVILSGMKIAQNNLASYQGGATNYVLDYKGGKFTIIPRPVNVEIENITKTYGQATDRVSCASGYDADCIVGEGLLIGDTQDANDSLLVNNFNIIDKSVAQQTITIGDSVGTITVVYGSAINMPTVVSVALVEGDTYYDYATVAVNKYYTETYADGDDDKVTGLEEKKNDTLNIKVERENYNIARGSDTCLVSVTGETYCEDVGEYFLSFNVRGTANTKESTVENAYYSSYWGYNPNYYVIVYNNFEASQWESGEYANSITAKTDVYYAATAESGVGKFSTSTVINESTLAYNGSYTANTIPGPTATLKIRKRSIQIVVETINEYEYTLKNDGTGNYIKIDDDYYLITDTNRYKEETRVINGASRTVLVQLKRGTAQATGQYVCTYATNNANVKDTNCYAITNTNTYTRKAKTVGERFNIEQNMNVPVLPTISNRGTDNSGQHHTTYEYITWYEQPRQVRVGDELYGNVAYCTTTLQLDGTNTLDKIREYASQSCASGSLKYYYGSYDPNDRTNSMYFGTESNGYYVITRDEDKLFIRNGESITDSTYEDNNYTTTFVNGVLQIDKDETAPVINVGTEFIIKEANGGVLSLTGTGTELAFLDTMKINNCTTSRAPTGNAVIIDCGATIFTYEDSSFQTNTATVSLANIFTLLDWFDISSYDPSIMRVNEAVGKRYDPRWYITIQNDFDQRKVGDYTIFIHAQDIAGNISSASMATLRIVDTTAPEVGTLHLYDTKVKCTTGTDCNVETNWVVDGDVYLPVQTFTSERLGYLNATITGTRYLLSSTGTYSANNYYGNYYKIPDGTDARAVKHTGWTNSSKGIWMVVIGGDDNSLTYLDTNKYAKKYTLSGDDYVESNAGTHLLLGSFVSVDYMTKYRAVSLSGNDEVTSGGTTTVYIPDISGTVIRYKGHYYDLVTGQYVGTEGTPADEYKVKLYSYDSSTKKYTKEATATYDSTNKVINTNYYILDGEMYNIPTTKYSQQGTGYKHDNSGTYVNFAQWDSYYTRDGGNSWIKYSRDTQESYLALGQDGQRLIMIKAIDNGYTYNSVDTTKKFVTDSYCLTMGTNMNCFTWNEVEVSNGYDITYDSTNSKVVASASDGKYDVYNGSKVEKYNISAWAEYAEGGNRDMKFAYLDTIMPLVKIDYNESLAPYEYDCGTDTTRCTNNHDEVFGKAIDGYIYDLDQLMKYKDVSGTYKAVGFGATDGTHVLVYGSYIEITASNRLSKNTGKTKECIGASSSSDCMYYTDANGKYIYLGATDSVTAIDELITGKIASRLVGTTNTYYAPGGEANVLQVYNNEKGAIQTITMPTTTTAETSANLQANTRYNASGLGMGTAYTAAGSYNTFDGTENVELKFGTTGVAADTEIDDKYLTIFIYADVRGGSTITGNDYLNNVGNYKFMINKAGASTYNVLRCYNATTPIHESGWCDSPASIGSFTNMKLAMNSLLAVYKDAGDGTNKNKFNANNITFTVDYRVTDLAGNMSMYVRKGLLFSTFVTHITANNPAVAQMGNRIEIEVEQNQDVAQLLSNFYVTSKGGAILDTDERIVQTMYYNGIVVVENALYDLTMLNSIDTAKPGEYKVVYTSQRRAGTEYVNGNSVELIVTVRPNVATVNNSNLDYLMISLIIVSMISLATVAYISLKKRENN